MAVTKGFALVVTCFCCSTLPSQGQSATPIPEVEALLAQMTTEEKIGQLNLITPGGGIPTGSVVSSNVEAKIRAGQAGGIFGLYGQIEIRAHQELAVEESRLKIPLIFAADIIHGYNTIFPIPLGISASWDLERIEKSARIAATEATADGIQWNFSPMVDISRDPRWGRVAEGAGEDPYLGSAIARAMVQGYQGNDLSLPTTMMACVKHLGLYGASEAGRDYNSVDMSRLKMYNEFFPPYKAAIEAGAGSIMSSFNDIDGLPASGNHWLLTELLRDQWGFDGFVVSDYTSVNEMTAHGLGNLQTVSALALNAGLDMDMVGEGYLTTLQASLDDHKLREEAITIACRRILEAKYKLGLFEDPFRYLDPQRPARDILSHENRQFARELAARTFVLLKRQGQVLPLSRTTKVALIGPFVDSRSNMLGTWAPTGDIELGITVLEGFQNMMEPDALVGHAKGANICDDPEFAKKINVFGDRITIDERSREEMLEEALKIVEIAEVIVTVVGEATEMSGESASRTNLKIPESQKKLIRRLVETGKPVVLVLMSGRPLDISEEAEFPVSILQVWHPGIEAGNAIADVVFGNYNPSGKLTSTWPRNVGQIPIYHGTKNTGRPATQENFEKFRSHYLDVPNSPLFPFGRGLSYTDFVYSDLRAEKIEIDHGEAMNFQVTIHNTGDYDGEEVVQLYLRDVVRSITPPMRQLKGFQKVSLKAGEIKSVDLVLHPNDLKFYNGALELVAEAGAFEVFVGTDSNANLTKSFSLVASQCDANDNGAEEPVEPIHASTK